MKGVLRAVGAGVVASASGAAWAATDLTVTVTNLSPNAGAFATPVWFGLHDGTFDLYDMGAPVSAELERIAEDGNVMPLRGAFAAGVSMTASCSGSTAGSRVRSSRARPPRRRSASTDPTATSATRRC